MSNAPITHSVSPAVDRVSEETLLQVLQPLLRIKTENPPGDEAEAAHFIGDHLVALGFEARYYEAAPNRANVIATLRGSGAGRSLILNGHLDTGLIGTGTGWTRHPLGAEIADGKIYGRGAGDMKTGIAAMVAAARAVVESGVTRRGDLTIAATADESSGSHFGMAHLATSAELRADMAIVCEPTGPAVGIAQRGVVWGEVTITGTSGQASRPWTGVNAISTAARVIATIEAWHASGPVYRRHPLLPSPTLTVATIEGGLKPNVIPEKCRFRFDRRLLPGESADEVLQQIGMISEGTAAAFGASVEIRELMRASPSEIPEDADVVRLCRRAFHAVTGRPASIRGAGGFTDARFFIHDLGIPAALFGPWYLTAADRSISDIPDEYAVVGDALTGAKVYAQIIADAVG